MKTSLSGPPSEPEWWRCWLLDNPVLVHQSGDPLLDAKISGETFCRGQTAHSALTVAAVIFGVHVSEIGCELKGPTLPEGATGYEWVVKGSQLVKRRGARVAKNGARGHRQEVR